MNFKHKIEYSIFYSFAAIISLTGFKSTKYWGIFIGNLFFYLIPIRKKVVIRNLSIAFPEKEKKEIRSLAHKNFVSTARTFCEIMCFPKVDENFIRSLLVFETDNFEKAINNNKNGGVLLTAHFGNWEFGAYAIGLLVENLHVLVKPQSNALVTNWLSNMRSKFNNKEVPTGVSVRELYKALKDNKYLGIVGDQRGPENGMRVNFFGRKTAVYAGAATFAVKLNSLVHCIFIARQSNDKFLFITKEIDYNEFEGTNDEITLKITQSYMSFLEETIRRFPEQWFWMHNIWKY